MGTKITASVWIYKTDEVGVQTSITQTSSSIEKAIEFLQKRSAFEKMIDEEELALQEQRDKEDKTKYP